MAGAYSLRDILCRDEVQNDFILRGCEALHHLGQIGSMNVMLLGGLDEPGDNALVCDRVAGFLQQVALSRVSSILRTWCALSIMMLFPKSREEVMRNTPVIQMAYFFGDERCQRFDSRMSLYLCGSKNIQAKTPAEIVIAECQLFTTLQTCE